LKNEDTSFSWERTCCGGCEGFNNLQQSVVVIAMSNCGMDLLPVRVEERRHWFVLAAAAVKGSTTYNGVLPRLLCPAVVWIFCGMDLLPVRVEERRH